MQHSINTVLRILRRTSLDRIEAYADKGNISSSKRERSFLRNFVVFLEFLSQSYSLVLRKQFDNTLFVESVKWDLGAHRGQWWKRNYPQIITREKLSERLLSDVCFHHTDFNPSLPGTVCSLCCVGFSKVIYGSSLGSMLKKEISSAEKWKKTVWETELRCVNATHRVTPFSSVFSWLTQFSGNLQWDTSERNEAYVDKGNILRWKL